MHLARMHLARMHFAPDRLLARRGRPLPDRVDGDWGRAAKLPVHGDASHAS